MSLAKSSCTPMVGEHTHTHMRNRSAALAHSHAFLGSVPANVSDYPLHTRPHKCAHTPFPCQCQCQRAGMPVAPNLWCFLVKGFAHTFAAFGVARGGVCGLLLNWFFAPFRLPAAHLSSNRISPARADAQPKYHAGWLRGLDEKFHRTHTHTLLSSEVIFFCGIYKW